MRHRWEQLCSNNIEQLSSVLVRMPPNYEKAVKLLLKGHTHSEIAAKLQLSRPRVSTMLKRALEIVEQEIAK